MWLASYARRYVIVVHRSAFDAVLIPQFLDRYGEHRIPVSSAKKISDSTIQRKEKEALRSEQIARLRNMPSSLNDSEEIFTSPELDEETDITAESESGVDSEAGLAAAAEARESSAIELSTADVDSLAGIGNVEYEQVGIHKFVKFADVLPAAPPRGVFDVQRIRESAYFFS